MSELLAFGGPMIQRDELRKTHSGSIELFTGPMFAGKTTALIKNIRRYTEAKYKTLIIKYSKDTRYGEEHEAVSHDQEKWEALPTMTLMPVVNVALEYEVIGVDEGQFFPDLIEFCELMAAYGKKVLIAALDGTFQRKPFGNIHELMPLCEQITKLKSLCVFCGKNASFSMRTTADESVEVIGGAEMYCAVCRKCYHENNTQVRTHKIIEYSKLSKKRRTKTQERLGEWKKNVKKSFILDHPNSV